MTNQEIKALFERIENGKRVTQKLCEQSKNLANYIQSNMEDLGVDSLMGGKYKLHTIKASVGTSVGLVLCVNDLNSYYDHLISLDTDEISATNETRYWCGDFNATYTLPSRQNVLEFLNDSKQLLEELANIGNTMPSVEIEQFTN